jgi:hypothetical protein
LLLPEASSFVLREKETLMATRPNLFHFRSKTAKELCGFTNEPNGERLPAKFGPWTGIGVIRADQVPPHGLSRSAIEEGITTNGYQLYRKKAAAGGNA